VWTTDRPDDVVAVLILHPGPIDHLLLRIGGKTVLDWTLSALKDVTRVSEIVVVAKKRLPGEVEALLRRPSRPSITLLEPVAHRLQAVQAALASTGRGGQVLLHDADRPLVTADGFAMLLAESAGSPAAVAAVPVKSSFKRVHAGEVAMTIPRKLLYHLQSPRIFQRDALLRTLDHAAAENWEGEDELAAARSAGLPVRLLNGHYFNVRITAADDARWAEMALARRLVPAAGAQDAGSRVNRLLL
jgi:2-C-methyl-D-erythritol 4-phosphate cytidylyltransferase